MALPTLYHAYYPMLVIWVALLWPALRLSGWARLWLVVVAAAGCLALLFELVRLPGSHRTAVVIIALGLWCLYVTAAGVLYKTRWRKAAALLSAALVLYAGTLTYRFVDYRRGWDRQAAVIDARRTLLFEAKFRNPETYERVFGPFSNASGAHPAGHWEASEHPYYSRLIINADGRVWLFRRCGDTECPAGYPRSNLQQAGERWEVSMMSFVGVGFGRSREVALRIERDDDDALSIELEPMPRPSPPASDRTEMLLDLIDKTGAEPPAEAEWRAAAFSKVPPPIADPPAQESLAFLGAFGRTDCDGRNCTRNRLWLWRGDQRLYAVGSFGPFVVGELHPLSATFDRIVMGEGLKDGGTWLFEWECGGKTWFASVAFSGPDVVLGRQRAGGSGDRVVLEPSTLSDDEVIDLAPLTSKEDWERWFDAVPFEGVIPTSRPSCG